MGLKKNSPGCGCCDTTDPTCSGCISGTTPASIKVSVTYPLKGIFDGNISCANTEAERDAIECTALDAAQDEWTDEYTSSWSCGLQLLGITNGGFFKRYIDGPGSFNNFCRHCQYKYLFEVEDVSLNSVGGFFTPRFRIGSITVTQRSDTLGGPDSVTRFDTFVYDLPKPRDCSASLAVAIGDMTQTGSTTCESAGDPPCPLASLPPEIQGITFNIGQP